MRNKRNYICFLALDVFPVVDVFNTTCYPSDLSNTTDYCYSRGNLMFCTSAWSLHLASVPGCGEVLYTSFVCLKVLIYEWMTCLWVLYCNLLQKESCIKLVKVVKWFAMNWRYMCNCNVYFISNISRLKESDDHLNYEQHCILIKFVGFITSMIWCLEADVLMAKHWDMKFFCFVLRVDTYVAYTLLCELPCLWWI